MSVAAIVATVLETSRRWRVFAAVNWSLVLLYLVLTFVAIDLAAWAMYHATFGRVHPDGPSEPLLLLSGLAAVVLGAGGILLPFYRLTGAVMAFAGLTVAIGAFGSWIWPIDGTSTKVFPSDVLGFGLAIAGMFMLARLARA